MHDARDSLHSSWGENWALAGAIHFQAPRGQNFPPHQHPSWEFTYYREGRIRCPVDGQVYWSQPGMIVLTRPGEVHWEQAVTAYANTCIVLDAPDLEPRSQVVFDDEYGTLRHLFGLVTREWTQRPDGTDQVTAALMDLLKALIHRARETSHLTKEECVVRDAESILEQRSGSPLLIRDIARELNVSPALLRQYFAHLRGHSPMEYLQSLRLQRALAAIRNSDAPLATIAQSCGYSSPSHLSRTVRRATGRTPGSFRAQPFAQNGP